MSRIRLRRGTATQWASVNPVLSSGEQGLDTTNGILKTGDGVTAWTALTGLDVSGDYVAQTRQINGHALSGDVTLTAGDVSAAPALVSGKAPVRKDKQLIDVRDWGVIGDGTSRPLSGLFGSLAAAQAVYPSAVALSDELDWAAFQSAVAANPGARFLIHRSLQVIINRPLIPTDNSRWRLDGEIINIWPYNTPSAYQDRATCIRAGNMHPAMMKRGYVDVCPIYELSAVASGDRAVTLVTPGALTLTAGSFVLVRSDSNPDPAGAGVTYDIEQLNKVKSFSGGVATLEMPTKVTIPSGKPPASGAGGAPAAPVLTLGTTASTGGRFFAEAVGSCSWVLTSTNASGESAGSSSVAATTTAAGTQVLNWSAVSGATGYKLYRTDPAGLSTLVAVLGAVVTYTDTGPQTVLSAPKLVVVTGTDSSNGQPWGVLDHFVLEGAGKLTGCLPFSGKMGAWRMRASWRGDTQDLLSSQCCVKSKFDVTGEFTSRLLEVKMVALDTKFRAHGVFRPDGTVTPTTTISIGEQASGLDLDLDLYRGTEHATNVRAFEIYAQDVKGKLRLHDFSTGGQTEVVAIKSTGNIARPPADIDLDLTIRSGPVNATTAKTSYMLIGSDANSDGIANDADPTRVRYKLNARTPDGLAATYAVVATRGSVLREDGIQGDIYRTNVINPADTPINAAVVLATLTGAVTYATGDTLLGSYTMKGVKLGDRVDVSMQQIATPTSGTFGDLYVSATVSAADTVRVYIRNRSATSVVFGTGTLFFLFGAAQRMRP